MSIRRVGFARVDLTPSRTGPNTGWGPMGRRDCTPPSEPAQRLFATAVALEDADGRRVVLVNADLHGGGWHLWKAAADGAGLPPSQVVLCGTHTHAGPGQRYGGFQYSLMAGPSPTDAWRSHRHLAALIARVTREAVGSLTPGGVALVRGVAADAASNRAVPAWRHYDDATVADFLERGPGSVLPPDAPRADRLRDPRVSLLAVQSEDRSLRGALGWFAVHGTALGPGFPTFGADLWGFAAQEAARSGWLVGFGGGASGDVSPLPVGEDGTVRAGTRSRPAEQGQHLAATIGRRVGAAAAEALDTIGSPDGPEFGALSLAAAHEVWTPRDSGLPAPMVGMAQFGGGVDGPNEPWAALADGIRSPRYRERAGRAYSMASGQGPKIAVAAALTRLPVRFGALFALVAPHRLPLHVIRVGDHALAAVPGEATTMAGWRIEQAVASAAGCSSASVVGFAGDYGGYWATPEEYLEQRYEGAATIFGRESATRLTERLAAIAGGLDEDDPDSG